MDLQLLCSGYSNTLNRELCCTTTPPLSDVLLGAFPAMEGTQQELAIDLLRELGSHSITVKQLK